MKVNDNVIDLIEELFALEETKKLEQIELYRNNPQLYLDQADQALAEVTNGPLLGILVSSVFTGLSGGFWLGALALGAGLVQLLLTPQPEAPRQPDAVFQPKYGTESLGGFARNGQVIPAIFTSRRDDPTGGVVTGGDLVHSRIETKDGNQYTYARFVISLGTIKNIAIDKTTVNEQPIQQFSDRDLKITWQPGTPDQKALPDYNFWSQNLPVSTNNSAGAGRISKTVNSGTNRIGVTNIQNFTKTYSTLFGIQATRWYRLNINPERFFTVASVDTANSTITINQDLKSVIGIGQTIQFSTPAGGIAGEITSLPTNSASYFNVPAEEFESYGNANRYIAVIERSTSENALYYPFRLLEKNKVVISNIAYYGLVIDTSIPNGNAAIYNYNVIQYQTTKVVNRLDLNFVGQVWGRNPKGELVDFACIYTLWLKRFNDTDFTCCAYFYIRSSNPNNLYRSITIDNLSLNNYAVEIRPEIIFSKSSFTGIPCIELADQGDYISVNTPYGTVKTQGTINTNTIAFLSGISSQDKERVPDNSNQRGDTLSLQHVNEIQTVERSGLAVDCSYKNLATVEVFVRSSELIRKSPNFAFFVTEGIILKKLLYSDTNYSDSNLYFKNINIQLNNITDLYIINLENNLSSKISKFINNEIYTIDNLQWEYGDDCLIYKLDSSCWWPEIYNDLASNPKYGAATQINANNYLDYKTLIENVSWVSGDNEHDTSFAWHGALTTTGKLNAINSENSKKVLLEPYRGDGRASFFPQQTPPISALYNASNSSNLKLEKVPKIRNDINTVTIVYREQENSQFNENALKFKARDITLQTLEAYYGNKNTINNTTELNTCTSYKQALVTGKILLNLSRYGAKKSLTFNGESLESMGLSVGHLIDVRIDDINNIAEYTGIVIDKNEDDYSLLDIELILVNSRSVTILANKLIDQNIDFIQAGVNVGDLVRTENGFLHNILNVKKHILSTDGTVEANKNYQILDRTFDNLVAKTISYNGAYKTQKFYQTTDGEGKQWLRFNSEQPNIGDIVSIGYAEEHVNIYQCLSVTPTIGDPDDNGKTKITVAITGVNWDNKFFNYSDIVAISRYGTFLTNT